MKLHTITVFLLSLLIAAGSALAQTATPQEDKEKNRRYLYEWKDDKGAVHITDNLGEVPEKYREKVRKRADAPSHEETYRGRERGGGAGSPSEAGQENEEAQKTEWQQKIREWNQRLANAEKLYQKLEQEKAALVGGWNTRSYVPPANMERAQQIEQEMKQVQQEIDHARNMIDVVIPDEARKAGIPPGWLRE